jgi:hypothetical protein
MAEADIAQVCLTHASQKADRPDASCGRTYSGRHATRATPHGGGGWTYAACRATDAPRSRPSQQHVTFHPALVSRPRVQRGAAQRSHLTAAPHGCTCRPHVACRTSLAAVAARACGERGRGGDACARGADVEEGGRDALFGVGAARAREEGARRLRSAREPRLTPADCARARPCTGARVCAPHVSCLHVRRSVWVCMSVSVCVRACGRACVRRWVRTLRVQRCR